jgi:hypothetical protein
MSRRSRWDLLVMCGVLLAFAPGCKDEGSKADAAVADAAPGGKDAGPADLPRDQAAADTGGLPIDASAEQPGGMDMAPGGACNDLSQPSLMATTVVTGRRPAADVETGGTLRDGDYVLTRFTVYDYSAVPGIETSMIGVNLRLRNGVMDSFLVGMGDSGLEQEQLSERITATGNKISSTIVCPANGGMEESRFTTDGTTLRLSQDDPALEAELVIELVRR